MNIVVREARADDARLMAELTRAAWASKVNVTSSGHRETAVQVTEHLRAGGGFVLELDGAHGRAAYEFELVAELEYSHANPLEAAPLVMRRRLKQ